MACATWVWTCLQLMAQTPQDVASRIEQQSSKTDGVYGRFDEDLEVSLGAGGELRSDRSAVALRSSAHYFSTAGLYVGAAFPLEPQFPTLLSFGVDLRPAFLPRFSENMQQGPAILDLALDSISISLGPYFGFGGDDPDERGSQGFEVGLGSGLALLGTSSGPWLEARGLVHIPDRGGTSLGGVVLLSYRQGVDSTLAQRAP